MQEKYNRAASYKIEISIVQATYDGISDLYIRAIGGTQHDSPRIYASEQTESAVLYMYISIKNPLAQISDKVVMVNS